MWVFKKILDFMTLDQNLRLCKTLQTSFSFSRTFKNPEYRNTPIQSIGTYIFKTKCVKYGCLEGQNSSHASNPGHRWEIGGCRFAAVEYIEILCESDKINQQVDNNLNIKITYTYHFCREERLCHQHRENGKGEPTAANSKCNNATWNFKSRISLIGLSGISCF